MAPKNFLNNLLWRLVMLKKENRERMDTLRRYVDLAVEKMTFEENGDHEYDVVMAQQLLVCAEYCHFVLPKDDFELFQIRMGIPMNGVLIHLVQDDKGIHVCCRDDSNSEVVLNLSPLDREGVAMAAILFEVERILREEAQVSRDDVQ
ncbi:hypothetical protein [Cutibacterium sp. V947]|uniref:hypothetical protein n=1 Tax=unclassified Cutibacterium TaxID=2649671 RepID=UPI003EE16A6B